MAITFSARAGSSFRTNVEYRNPPVAPDTDPQSGSLIDVTGYTARLQVRSGSGNRSVLVSSTENTQGSVLVHDPDQPGLGSWNIYLSAAVTRILPPVSHLEVELVADADVNDVTLLFSGALHVSPEVVY
jgi:hypothetical protein